MKGLKTESGDKTRPQVTPSSIRRIRNLSLPKHSLIPTASASTRPVGPMFKLWCTLPEPPPPRVATTSRDSVRQSIEKIEQLDFGVYAKKPARAEVSATSKKKTQNVIRLFRDRLRMQWYVPGIETHPSHLEMTAQKQELTGRPQPKRSIMTAYHHTRMLPQVTSPRCALRKPSTLLAAWEDN